MRSLQVETADGERRMRSGGRLCTASRPLGR
jgi:hypothetical protein